MRGEGKDIIFSPPRKEEEKKLTLRMLNPTPNMCDNKNGESIES